MIDFCCVFKYANCVMTYFEVLFVIVFVCFVLFLIKYLFILHVIKGANYTAVAATVMQIVRNDENEIEIGTENGSLVIAQASVY